MGTLWTDCSGGLVDLLRISLSGISISLGSITDIDLYIHIWLYRELYI